MSFYTFRRRTMSCGNNIRDEKIGNTRKLLKEIFFDDPAYTDNVVIYNTTIEIHPRVFIEKDRTTGTPQVQFQTLIDEPFEVGDIFQFSDGENWMCSFKPSKHNIYHQGTIDYCNYMLHFKSKKNGDKINIPVCMINATQYNSGGKYRDQMSVGTSQQMIFIPCNEETILLDHDERLMIDTQGVSIPTVYKISQVDTTTYDKGGKGVLRYTVVEDKYNAETDDKDILVADYNIAALKDKDGNIVTGKEVWWD